VTRSFRLSPVDDSILRPAVFLSWSRLKSRSSLELAFALRQTKLRGGVIVPCSFRTNPFTRFESRTNPGFSLSSGCFSATCVETLARPNHTLARTFALLQSIPDDSSDGLSRRRIPIARTPLGLCHHGFPGVRSSSAFSRNAPASGRSDSAHTSVFRVFRKLSTARPSCLGPVGQIAPPS